MQQSLGVGIACFVSLVIGCGLSTPCTYSMADTYGTIWVNSNNSIDVTIPCGYLDIFLSDSGHILTSSIDDGLTNISPTDVNYSNTALQLQEHSYQNQDVLREIELEGFREPVFGQPFHMECPLVGSPSTLYHWKKYETVDMSTETNFSADVRFSDNGRIWYVDIVTAEHSGMYVCHALNGGEEKTYVDITNFFLSISGCPYHAPQVTVQIAPTGIKSYKEGESVPLVCTAVAVEHHEQPFWWKEHANGTMTLCSRQQYMLNNSFEMSACRWTTVLTIPHLSQENTGNYHCRLGNNSDNFTLYINDEIQTSSMGLQVAVILLIVMIVLIVCAVLVYMQPLIQLQCTKEPPCDGFTYDAFISAHDEAKDFVLENILYPLESLHNSSSRYRLCWHSRDFIPGIPIMEQITKCIAKSRKIIFVFSEHFLQSKFCHVELELAMNRYLSSNTRCIVPVALTEKDVPANVKQMITYLPILSAGNGNVAEKIAQIMGKPTPV